MAGAVSPAALSVPTIGGGTFSGKGSTPSQGRIEEIFRAATINRCGNTIHIRIFKSAWDFGHGICLTALFGDLLGFYYTLDLQNQLRVGLIALSDLHEIFYKSSGN